jgi:hypothetical protein
LKEAAIGAYGIHLRQHPDVFRHHNQSSIMTEDAMKKSFTHLLMCTAATATLVAAALGHAETN